MKWPPPKPAWTTEKPAGLSLVAGIDENNQENSSKLKVPALLSFLSYIFSAAKCRDYRLRQAAETQYGREITCRRRTGFLGPFRLMVTSGLL